MEYIGDVNLVYGGAFFDLGDARHGYVTAVRVTNLDDAIGADGLILVEVVYLYALYDRESICRALSTCGMKVADLRGRGRENILIMIADAQLAYGCYDRLNGWANYTRPAYWVMVLADVYGGNKASWGEWEVDIEESVKLHRQYQGDILAYLESEVFPWIE